MSRFFRWTMRNGAKIILVVALLQLAVGLVIPFAKLLTETSRMAADFNYRTGGGDDLILELSQLLYSLTNFAFLLIGALIVDRADRWLSLRERGEAER